MQIQGALTDRTPYNKFIIVVGLLLIFATVFAFLSNSLAMALYGVNVLDPNLVVNEESSDAIINAMKFVQGGMAIGTFLLPALGAAILFSTHTTSYLHIDRKPKANLVVLAVAMMIIAVPFINWMAELNSHVSLPDGWKVVEDWMKQKEDQATQITSAFLKDTSMMGLLVNLLVIALIPAVGEELLFRGVIQKLFIDLTAKKTAGIVLTALLFSALHMQFYGFFPRFMLGMALGFLLEWSGTLWLPIIAHFVNNAAAVILSWLIANQMLGMNPDTIGVGEGQTIALVVSVVVTSAILRLIRERSRA